MYNFFKNVLGIGSVVSEFGAAIVVNLVGFITFLQDICYNNINLFSQYGKLKTVWKFHNLIFIIV